VFNALRASVVMFVLMTAITGVAYPALVTAIAQVFFPHQANGSLIDSPSATLKTDAAIGSELIGQPFSADRYFWGRPSATAPTPYNAAASTGSNFGPTNPAQWDAVRQRLEALHASIGEARLPAPVDLVTASGSGLDPHISPAAAEYQVSRVARARGLQEGVVRRVVAEHTEGRTMGWLGEPRVNVLRLNISLDQLPSPSERGEHPPVQ
jgi:potassium-transporting ATPase KdpC subunit